uniref:DNA helicase n=1 Tax=Neobacillus citreus TaxID=2833578 RepID=A0A942SXX7_9BACI
MTTIEIPRKRRKQIKKLKGQTASLLGEQRKVLEHANAILAEARSNAADAARKDIAPRVQNAIDNGIRPAVASGVHAATTAAQNASHRFQSEVVPGLVSTAGSVLSVVDLAKDPRVQKIVKDAQKKGKKAKKSAAKYVPAAQQKKGIGFGGVALIVVGVVAVAGAAYAAYQTLRADDDLWVADDADTAEKPSA